MFKNSINGKRYIGSELRRLRQKIYEIDFGCASNILIRNHLLRNKCMAIYYALLKHGYSNFSLTILEYCSPDKRLIREKHYWDLFNPEYNIAKEPGAPMSGRKHSDKTNKKKNAGC